MRSREVLTERWHELARLWQDDAARSFEDQHLSQIMKCMESLDREYERFLEAASASRSD